MVNIAFSSLQANYKTVKFGKVPNRNVDICTRKSQLLPLTGRLPMRKEEIDIDDYRLITDNLIKQKVRNLIDMWRKRVVTFSKYGWSSASTLKRMTLLSNCYPNFVIVDTDRSEFVDHKAIQYCYQESVCPFCYSRVIQDVYLRLTDICKNYLTEGSSNLLIGYKIISKHNEKKTDSIFDTMFSTIIHNRRRIYDQLGGMAGYTNTTVEPVGDYSWVRIQRGLVLAPNRGNKTFSSIFPKGSSIITVKEYKANKLITLVSDTLRYPTRLMLSKRPDRVVNYLHAKQKLRMSSTMGLMRNKNA
jgi:hypothetical protein